MKEKIKKHKKLILILIVAIIAVDFFISGQKSKPKVYKSNATYTHTQDIEQLFSDLGVPQSVSSKLQTIQYDSNSNKCQSAWAEGCLIDDNLYYSNTLAGMSTNTKRIVIAHEYLHYIWQINPDLKAKLTPVLKYTYQNNKEYLDKRLGNYTKEGIDDETFVDELHSYIGTELNYSKLPPLLQNHYSEYLANRSAITPLY